MDQRITRGCTALQCLGMLNGKTCLPPYTGGVQLVSKGKTIQNSAVRKDVEYSPTFQWGNVYLHHNLPSYTGSRLHVFSFDHTTVLLQNNRNGGSKLDCVSGCSSPENWSKEV